LDVDCGQPYRSRCPSWARFDQEILIWDIWNLLLKQFSLILTRHHEDALNGDERLYTVNCDLEQCPLTE
jgi:hypothetical protein